VLIELNPVDRITADAVGEPGGRVFYIQGRHGDRLVTLLVEKQQVQLLAASVVEILSRVGKETGQGPPEDAMGLEEPVEPEWRAGRLSIGYQEDRDLLVLEAEEVAPEPEEDADEADEDVAGSDVEASGTGGQAEALETLEALERELAGATPDLEGLGQPDDVEPDQPPPRRVRFWATREQMLSLARHGAAVCAKGRPRCQLCGNPIDPEGHVCPALNGHGQLRDA
jgi:uncharacterized repeat protein (TIGR03847 family)